MLNTRLLPIIIQILALLVATDALLFLICLWAVYPSTSTQWASLTSVAAIIGGTGSVGLTAMSGWIYPTIFKCLKDDHPGARNWTAITLKVSHTVVVLTCLAALESLRPSDLSLSAQIWFICVMVTYVLLNAILIALRVLLASPTPDDDDNEKKKKNNTTNNNSSAISKVSDTPKTPTESSAVVSDSSPRILMTTSAATAPKLKLKQITIYYA